MGKRKARHAAMKLDGLAAWRARPEGPIETVQTNWTPVPSNDNVSPEDVADMRLERRLEIVPSLQAIRAEMHNEPTRNAAGQITSIGALRFSDGNQTEKAYTYGPEGKLIQYDCRLPVGAMIGCREKADAQAGGKGLTQGQVSRSNDFFASAFKTDAVFFITAKRERRKGKSYTNEESRAMLDKAIANTPNLPSITYCPPALPAGTRRVAENFLGMQKAKKGESGSMMWQDIASAKVSQEIWDEALAAMKSGDVATLEAVSKAKTFADVSPGGTDRGARKRGKRETLVANDNMIASLRKAAA